MSEALHVHVNTAGNANGPAGMHDGSSAAEPEAAAQRDRESAAALVTGPATNQNVPGTYGEVVLDGDASFTTGGVVVRATTASRPNIIMQPTSNGAFIVASVPAQVNLYVPSNGAVGIGTVAPGTGGVYATPLTIHSTHQFGSFLKISNSDAGYKMGGVWLQDNEESAGWLFGVDNVGKALIRYGAGANETLAITAAKDGTNGLAIDTSGNVGIGTSAPNAKLHVAGNIIASGSITGATVLGATFQDIAEWVPSSHDLDDGTVVVLDRRASNQVMPSTQAYDTMVAGVVSARPGVILGEASPQKEMIATTGRVKVRVDATREPIAIGDLLVTSDRPGTAMKSIPIEVAGVAMHRPGTLIGKALEPLASGQAEILVLLSLQ